MKEKFNIRSFSIIGKKYKTKITYEELETCLEFELEQNSMFLAGYFVLGGAVIVFALLFFLKEIIKPNIFWPIIALGSGTFIYGILAYQRNVSVIFDEYYRIKEGINKKRRTRKEK